MQKESSVSASGVFRLSIERQVYQAAMLDKVNDKGSLLNDGGVVQCFQLVKYNRTFTS